LNVLPADVFSAVRRIEIRTRHLVSDSFAGEYQSVFKGRGIEFDDVRQYQPGDDVRTIDWNVTARTGEPFVKRYVEERELTAVLAFDASASGHFGTAGRMKRALGAELGAVLAFSAISNNDKVGMVAFTDRTELHIPPRKGRRHVLRLIRDLLAFEPEGRGTDITLALDRLNRVLKRRSIIFLISDFLAQPQEYERALSITARRHDLIAITITDPREIAWPSVGLVVLTDAETGSTAYVDTDNASWRQAFEQRSAAKQEARRHAFAAAKIDFVDITVGEDYVGPLLSFFEKRARRLR
jgi:uncharacterized protein (DUF58 family)